ncbi:MAG: hypothetical protein AB8B48_20630 [Pseudomonadales bacterium]
MDLARCYDMGLAAVMKAALISEDIQVLDYTGSGHVSIAGADHSYYVKVPEQEYQRARKVLIDSGYEKYII